jgi:hypothetical protein
MFSNYPSLHTQFGGIAYKVTHVRQLSYNVWQVLHLESQPI